MNGPGWGHLKKQVDMDVTTAAGHATAAARCFHHKGSVGTGAGPAVLVGAIERGSGPVRPVYACTPCVERHGILPLVEHPDSSDGHPLYRDGRPLTGSGTPS